MTQHCDASHLPPGDRALDLDPLFTDDTLSALIDALPGAHTDTAEHRHRRKAAAMHLLRSFDVRHPVEAALATQAVLSHYCAVAAFRRAACPDRRPGTAAREIDSALRSSERFTHLLDELDLRQRRVSPTATPSPEPIP